ncbi:MAG: hypothetical protein A2X46_18440 [Lentisphaerae bacterium GWF2_57_35]|nr:MAG: hypothetical protein A2X46_18440 [Lentisphaerae bacterium GWF2_57_35]
MPRSFKEHCRRRLTRWTGLPFGPPRTLAIEPTNHCTRKCPVCGAHSGQAIRPRGFMDWNLFLALADQIQALKPARVSLYGHGEPLLHPRLPDMTRELAQRGLHTEIVTNGDLLDAELLARCSSAGLGSLIVSHPGITPANYKACRGELQNTVQEDRLRSLIQSAAPSCDIYIRSLVLPQLLNDGPAELASFVRGWLTLPGIRGVGLHGYQPWPRHGLEQHLGQLFTRARRCELGMETMTVLWNGTVTLCSYDSEGALAVGQAPGLSLLDAYRGAEARRRRKAWFGASSKWPELCRDCLLPRCAAVFIPLGREILRSETLFERQVRSAYDQLNAAHSG